MSSAAPRARRRRRSIATRPPRCSARSSMRPHLGFPGSLALVWRFDPMCDRVAQQVGDRVRDAVEDHAVELCLGAAHVELHLLARVPAARSRTALGNWPVIELSGRVRIWIDRVLELAEEAARRRPSSVSMRSSSGSAPSSPSRCSSRRLCSTVSPTASSSRSTFSGRDAHGSLRAAVGHGRRGGGAGARPGLGVGGAVLLAVASQAPRASSVACSSGSVELLREHSVLARALERVLHRVRDRLHVRRCPTMPALPLIECASRKRESTASGCGLARLQARAAWRPCGPDARRPPRGRSQGSRGRARSCPRRPLDRGEHRCDLHDAHQRTVG